MWCVSGRPCGIPSIIRLTTVHSSCDSSSGTSGWMDLNLRPLSCESALTRLSYIPEREKGEAAVATWGKLGSYLLLFSPLGDHAHTGGSCAYRYTTVMSTLVALFLSKFVPLHEPEKRLKCRHEWYYRLFIQLCQLVHFTGRQEIHSASQFRKRPCLHNR